MNRFKYIRIKTLSLICIAIISLSILYCSDRGDSALISGKETYLNGDYKKASEILGASILHLHNEMEKLKEGGAESSKIKQKIEKSAEAFFYRGLSYKNLEMWGDAIKDFSVTLNMSPNYIKAYSERAVCFYELGFSKRSLEDLERAINGEPDNPSFLYNRANIHLKLKDYQKAILDASRSIELEPNSANSHCIRAEAYRSIENYQKAIDDYKKSIKLFSSNKYLYETYLSLGKCYYSMSKKVEAEEAYRTAFLYNKKPYLAYFNLSIMYGEDAKPNSEEMEKAINFGIKASELSEFTNDKPLVYLASLYFKIEDYEKAYEIQKLAKDLNPYDEEIEEWLDIYDNKRKVDKD